VFIEGFCIDRERYYYEYLYDLCGFDNLRLCDSVCNGAKKVGRWCFSAGGSCEMQ
jgi:hypothetical protein